MSIVRWLFPVLAASFALLACGGPNHVRHETHSRRYTRGKYDRAPTPVSEGSVWLDSSRGLFADFRATQVGDVVTIRIDETASASGDANTDLNRQSSRSIGVPSFFGLQAALQRQYPDLNPAELLKLVSDHQFTGDGETRRGSSARGMLAVRVKEQLPNSDLFVEGTKVILINDEELHIYLSGVIRQADIQQDNSVRSSLVADAQIEFTGSGTLTDNQNEGWLSRILSAISPF